MAVPHKWTQEEDGAIRSAYALSSFQGRLQAIRAAAAEKGVPVSACHGRARTLGFVLLTRNACKWTKAELEQVEFYAGRIPKERLARMLHRSINSINIQLSRMQISSRTQVSGYTSKDLADLTGMEQRTLRIFLLNHPMRRGKIGTYPESAVQMWIWDNLEHFELRKFDQQWLKSMLKRAA